MTTLDRSAMILLLLTACVCSYAQTPFWEETNGPDSVAISCFAADSAGRVFAADYRSGLYMSADDGAQWSLSGFAGIPCLEAKLDRDGQLLVCNYDGVFRSTDGGQVWVQILVPTSRYVYANSIASTFPGHLIVSLTHLGLLQPYLSRSTDNGVSWSPYVGTNGEYVWLTSDTGGTVYGINSGSLMKSTDDGISWALKSPSWSVNCVAIGHPKALLAGTAYDGMFRSTDMGEHWEPINMGLPVASIHSLAVLADGRVYAGTDSGAFKSTNNGDSWSTLGLSRIPILSIFGSPQGAVLAATVHSILRSTDEGNNWLSGASGFPKPTIPALAVDPDGLAYAAASWWGGMFRTSNSGNEWIELFGGAADWDIKLLFAASDRSAFAGTTTALYRSTDQGNNWTTMDTWFFRQGVNALLNDSIGGYLFAGPKSGSIVRSTDGGRLWYEARYYFGRSQAISFASASNGDLFVCGCCNAQIYRSADHGDSWLSVPTPGTNVSRLVVASTGRIVGFDSDDGTIWRSSNNGQQWESFVSGMGGSATASMVINSRNWIFLSTPTAGVAMSTDEGATWAKVNSGLSDSSVQVLALMPSGYLLAGTASNGVFRSMRSTTSIEETSDPLPTEFKLLQNYPNPFNPSTQITYSIPARSEVKLSVCNVLGQEVATLVNDTREKGTYTAEFAAANYSSGVYFYTIKAGQFSETRKMLLMK
jgi:photosystem II stability/assembly factor-like uncharacterized protein